ncbi:MAG: DUF2029 domain-containing protein [Clostridia bacterium]|nr:DUF2029 domain-containing protein [Clostridia bacterium]
MDREKISNSSEKKRGPLASFGKNFSPARFFVLLMALSFTVYLIFYMVRGQAGFVDIFFLRTKDLFMDFFNSVRDASQGAEVYTVRHVIYPPMANLIYLICSRFLPTAFNQSGWYERLTWRQYPEAIFFITVFTLILTVILYTLIHESVKGSKTKKFLFAFFAVFSVPILHMLERGNMILFCLIALFVYAFTYNSENKIHREIGLLCLAFAFSLKLYPVIFGWMLLTDKRYKDGIRCALYGLLMLILPSIPFGGFSCFVQIFKNITSFSGGSTTAISVISAYSGIPAPAIKIAAYIWCFICVACFILAPFIHKEKRWKMWMLGVLVIITVPSLSSLYVWAFLLIPMIMIENSEKRNASDWFFFVIMSLLFAFTLLRFNSYLTLNTFLMFPFIAILSITAVADTVICGVRRLRSARAAKSMSKEN